MLTSIERLGAWARSAGDARRAGLVDAYTARCLTLGRRVRAMLPGDMGDMGDTGVDGRAERIDDVGRLMLRLEDGTLRAVSAGDVVHLR